MRSSQLIAVLCITIVITACGTVPTVESQYNVLSGSEVPTVSRMAWDGDCSSRRPSIRVVTKPEHGELSVRPEKMFIGAGADIGRNVLCKGRRVTGSVVFYIPNEGFKGEDIFLLESTVPGVAGATRNNVIVTVR